ncbi:hypothetical protein PIROE2DRAFT_57934 [Piromyces sp. E2]|nr:hypothetical protein PIROE2DRAFT_57934 [Piromyces sp. E2]|eukprot:OUM68727.1 hypothetical protein PIROE2DRAFT_57934 [Piromyces sp. E2]
MSGKKVLKNIAMCALGILPIFIFILIFALSSGKYKDIGAKSIYKCDYISFALNTKIKIYNDTEDDLLYAVEGNILKWTTDPLTLYDEKQNHKKIMYAGDSLNFFSQDSHSIQSLPKKESLCEMEGKFSFSGNSYKLYINNTYTGDATFNSHSTHGEVKTKTGDLIADFYRKNIFVKDYTVQIKENNIFSDETLLMIFASFVSDYTADEEND